MIRIQPSVILRSQCTGDIRVEREKRGERSKKEEISDRTTTVRFHLLGFFPLRLIPNPNFFFLFGCPSRLKSTQIGIFSSLFFFFFGSLYQLCFILKPWLRKISFFGFISTVYVLVNCYFVDLKWVFPFERFDFYVRVII